MSALRAVAQPDPGHAVAFREGFQQKKLRVAGKKALPAAAVLRQVQEALVQKKTDFQITAAFQYGFYQLWVSQPPSGIIGVAEEKNLRLFQT